MGRKPNNKTEDAFLSYLRSGRDEMNLIEHSISSAGTQVDRKTTSILFESEAKDPETGEPVEQSWEISFSGKYGRPTATDDDVFVALMKVSHEEGFSSPQVNFTSRQLIRILGWDEGGKSYRAIDSALNRLCGVRIVATNYWYDNRAKLWADRKFGIIDDVFLYERAKYDRAKRAAFEAGDDAPKSWLRWSDVMQESFEAGYIRKLDIEVYREISNPVARKLYRYLGKHFWKKRTHTIGLEELAVEKLGYKETTELRELRRRIAPAIKELEELGVFGLSHDMNSGYGRCDVVFKKGETLRPKRSTVEHPLVARLRSLGVFEADAWAAVKRHTEERILTDIEDVEFRARQGQVRASKAGLLSKLLKEDQPSRPEGFASSADRKRQAAKAAKRKAEKERADEERRRRETEQRERTKKQIDAFLAAMESDSDREAFAEEAFANNTFYRKLYRDCVRAGETERAEDYREQAIEQLWEKREGVTRQVPK